MNLNRQRKTRKLKNLFQNQRQKTKNHQKNLRFFLSNANRRNHKIVAKFMTINKMNEIQKSNFLKNFQNDFVNT